MRALRGGRKKMLAATLEQSARKVDAALAQLQEKQQDGTLLGISKSSPHPVVLSDSHINQMVLVLGTTGSGKTVTVATFLFSRLIKKLPVDYC